MLMAAYAYYETDYEMVPDYVFDEWYDRLKRLRYRIKHPHLHLIDTSENGSGGCTLGIKYPGIVKGALSSWRRRYE
jgi:NAD-dependent DNA ligase